MQPVALITGSSGGIGRALVKAFGDAGYGVIGLDLGAADAVPSLGFVEGDLLRFCREPAYRDQLVAGILGLLPGGRLDVLINNAALQVTGSFEATTVEDWFRTMDVNLNAPSLLVKALLGRLEAAGGCVINISSIHAQLTKPGFVAYATSKAALSGFTRALAVEIGSRVRVNAIAPAAIGTSMLLSGFEGNPEAFKRLQEFHPTHSIGAVGEVAALALAIARRDMAFLNGAVLALDGGIGARLHDPV